MKKILFAALLLSLSLGVSAKATVSKPATYAVAKADSVNCSLFPMYTIQDVYNNIQREVYFSGCNGCLEGIDRGNRWIRQHTGLTDVNVYDVWNAMSGYDCGAEEFKNIYYFM